MENNVLSINFNDDDYLHEGMYLHLSDSHRLVITRESVEKSVNELWNNPYMISDEIKNSKEFQRCSFCPGKNQPGFCPGLSPILPLLETIDNFNSFDPVIAVYKEKDDEPLTIASTTMQKALSYVANTSLKYYCLYSKEYWRYYIGVTPLSSPESLVSKIYLNIFWLYQGNITEIERNISQFHEVVTLTTRSQVTRLNMICKSDAFINAFINAQETVALLSMSADSIVNEQFAS